MSNRIGPLAIAAVIAALTGLFVTGGASSQPSTTESRSERIAHLPTETRYALRALQYLLTDDEFDALLSRRHDEDIRYWIAEYWKSKDPIYTTVENEMLLEHVRRIAYAESVFAIRRWPMWDQRGEIYIRYGPPSYRQSIPAEVSAAGISPPGELWYYDHYKMYILFEDPASSGEYSYYLERVKGPPGIRMEKIGSSIDAVSKNLGVIAPPSISYESVIDKWHKMLRKFDEVLETAPASYPFNLERNQLPFVFTIDNFRGGEKVTRVEFNIEFRADMSWRERGPRANDYLATAVLWNTDHAEVGRREQRMTIPLAAGTADSSRLMPTQLVLSVPPGFYFAAVTLEERPSGRIASYRKSITCYDFQTTLAISDILLASRIVPATRNSLFNRGALEVVPHPIRRYRYPAAVPVYFEVYNLARNNRGTAEYDVSYRVISKTPRTVGLWDRLRGKKPTLDITSSFHTSSLETADEVHITIGSNNLWPGTFVLEITIFDTVSGASVNRKLAFEMLE